MLEQVGIKMFYNETESKGYYSLKESVEDFIVQEVVDKSICQIRPIVDLPKFMEANFLINNLPDFPSKEERKKIYSIANYHPFLRLQTKNNAFEVQKSTRDIFLCTVLKYNYSSNSLVNYLSKKLNISQNCIQLGGSKDKRAITLQEISINCRFEDLFNLAISLDKSNQAYKYSNLGYTPKFEDINKNVILEMAKYMNPEVYEIHESLMIYNIRRGHSKFMGDLDGNLFTIKINNLFEIQSIPKYFINYFGHQRFGNQLNNHIIGKYILENDFDEAVFTILSGSNNSEIDEIVQALINRRKMQKNFSESTDHSDDDSKSQFKKETETIEKNNDEKISKKFISNLVCNMKNMNMSRIQRFILKMIKNGSNSKNIILSLTRMNRMIYMHAYQSYLFNLEANSRILNQENMGGAKIELNGELIDASSDSNLNEIIIPLKSTNDKLMKGGYRKMIEIFKNLEITKVDSGIILKFFLNKSCYATMALREIIGESVCDYDKNEDY